jgi:hypothetical protein
MLETVTAGESVRAAVATLSAEFGQPADVIERDLLTLCRSLADRGLIEQHAAA